MENGIYVSINYKAALKIEEGFKNHEFRNYIPKQDFKKLYVYVTKPSCKLKYILEIDDIIHFPNKIAENGDGNYEFNNGEKKKYAYHISRVYKLEYPISLKELKEKYKFMPPQSFVYKNRYLSLTEYLEKAKKTLIWENKKII